MKTSIHPKWFRDTEVICACGNMFRIGSTKPKIKIEICHKCHPYYTGEMKFVDTMGRVEKFQKKQKEAVESLKILKEKKLKKAASVAPYQPKTLREMLLGQ